MGCVHGVAQQDYILMVPVLCFEGREADPFRVVRQQRGSIQVIGKKLLAVGQAFCFIGFIQFCLQPGSLITLDDESAGRAAERIGMDLKQAMFILTKNEGESIKHLISTKPYIPGPAKFNVGLENRCVGLANDTIQTISGNEQIIVVKLYEIIYLATKF